MSIVILGVAVTGAVILIGVGLWVESRADDRTLSPLQGDKVSAQRVTAISSHEPALPSATLVQRVVTAAGRHPVPLLAWIETLVWLLVPVTILHHVAHLSHYSLVWNTFHWIVLIPHEIGHLVCSPFGWTLTIAGGSIWQVLVFVLPAVYLFLVHRQITASLVFWVMAGHSLIDMAPYIADARARELPLLFGPLDPDKKGHDWWNLLGHFGLLEYDQVIADMTVGIGAAIIMLAVGVGILTAWLLPRTQLGLTTRFEGSFFSALRGALNEPLDDFENDLDLESMFPADDIDDI